jgi:hypothetical protein
MLPRDGSEVERCVSERIDDGESQQGLDNSRVMVYKCMVEELSGVVVALTVGLTRLVC